MHCSIGALFEKSNDAGPAAQGEQRRRQIGIPFLLGDSKQLERLADALERTDFVAFQMGKVGGEAAEPGIRRAERLPVQCAEGTIQTLVAPWQLPMRQPLVQERAAEWNEQIVDEQVGVGPAL